MRMTHEARQRGGQCGHVSCHAHSEGKKKQGTKALYKDGQSLGVPDDFKEVQTESMTFRREKVKKG